jgi:hypothetical protein
MTRKQVNAGTLDVKALLEQDADYLRAMVAASTGCRASTTST